MQARANLAAHAWRPLTEIANPVSSAAPVLAHPGALTHLGVNCTVEADAKALPSCERAPACRRRCLRERRAALLPISAMCLRAVLAPFAGPRLPRGAPLCHR